MEYYIRRWGNPDAFIVISESEYSALVSARQSLTALLGAEEKFDAVLENYIELEEAIFHEGLQHLTFRHRDSLQRSRNRVSRRILNLFASCRLYLDALPQHAATILAKDSQPYHDIISAPSREYDQSVAYRAMEALRNHAQHFDLPVHAVSVGSSKEGIGPELRWAHSFTPALTEEELSRNSKFKRPVLVELFDDKEGVDLMPLVREYVERLGNIHEQFRISTAEREGAGKERIEAATARYLSAYPDDEKGLALLAVVPMEGDVADGDAMFLYEGEDRAFLKSKNAGVRNLSKRYVKW